MEKYNTNIIPYNYRVSHKTKTIYTERKKSYLKQLIAQVKLQSFLMSSKNKRILRIIFLHEGQISNNLIIFLN